MAAASLPQVAVSQYPMPITPPVRATARSSSSDKFLLLLQVPFTPVCEITTGPGGDGSHVAQSGGRTVGQINQHVLQFHFADPGAPQIGKATFAHAGCSAAYGSVSKVGGRHHAKAGVVQLVQVIQPTFQRLSAFGAKE